MDTISVSMSWLDTWHVAVMDECGGFTQAEACLEPLFVEETEFNALCVLCKYGEVRSGAIESSPKRIRAPRPDKFRQEFSRGR